MCVGAYVYICTSLMYAFCAFTYTHACMHTYTRTYKQTYIHMCILQVGEQLKNFTWMYNQKTFHIQMCMCVCVYIYIYIYIILQVSAQLKNFTWMYKQKTFPYFKDNGVADADVRGYVYEHVCMYVCVYGV